jgi:hypothetical protein
MVEGEEQAMIETAAREIAGAISAEIGGAA